MRKIYSSAPLPFVGQKRMFSKEFRKVLEYYPDDVIIIDLFGGSGLLSHVAHSAKPSAKVVYNDYDGYHNRIENIRHTNILLRDLRLIIRGVPHHKMIPPEIKKEIIKRISEEQGFVDYITISSSVLFSMKYVLNIDELKKETLYNNIRLHDYDAEGYLDGLNVVKMDYRDLFFKYKNEKNVLFLVDPPYLCTDVHTYKMSWGLQDYLDVLTVLRRKSYVYFTSNKSSIIELCDWIGKHQDVGNPFSDARIVKVNANMNYNSKYTDIMLYNNKTEQNGK